MIKIGGMMKVKISLVLNILIIILVLLGSIFMFTGFTFMPSKTLLEASKIEMFKFYTVDSNILMALISFVFVIFEIKNDKHIPKGIYILKMVGTSAIALTFLVTLLFLAPQYGFYAMYNNNNLFFHLIVPVLSITTYILFEKYDNKYRYALLGIIPMFIYSIYYTSLILINLDNGGLTFKYDFYGFLNGNINNIYIVIPSIYLVSYLISLSLVCLNKKIK